MTTRPYRALLLEGIHPGARDALAAEGLEVTLLPSSPPKAELLELVKTVDVLGIRSKTQITAEVLAAAPDLLTIGCFCIGTNQVDLDVANKRGVPVFNAPLSNTRSVAELMIAEIIVLSRQLGDRSREVHEGIWNKNAKGCHEIRGKNLGIIGYGHIGRQVGVLAEAMGMRVTFYDVASRLPMGNNRPAHDMDQLLSESDFVTLHVPETRETKNMIGAAQIARMRKGAYLLNASRGTVVVIEELASALRSGHLAGAAVDVYPEEPEANGNGFESELRGLPNVILSPHIGGSTMEAQEAIGKEVSTSLAKFVSRGVTTSAVNFPEVERPLVAGKHRILNVHRNVPGVLRDINRIVSDSHANIHAQVLATDQHIGYLVMDLDQDVSEEVCAKVGQLETSLRTRILT
ncbi:MAG: phosphoglycerate dehydrogenase [Polyangiaceae bacterium]